MSHVCADKIAKIIVLKNTSSRQYPWVGEIQTLFFINSRINLICILYKPNDFTKNLIKEDYQDDHEFLSSNKLKWLISLGN